MGRRILAVNSATRISPGRHNKATCELPPGPDWHNKAVGKAIPHGTPGFSVPHHMLPSISAILAVINPNTAKSGKSIFKLIFGHFWGKNPSKRYTLFSLFCCQKGANRSPRVLKHYTELSQKYPDPARIKISNRQILGHHGPKNQASNVFKNKLFSASRRNAGCRFPVRRVGSTVPVIKPPSVLRQNYAHFFFNVS